MTQQMHHDAGRTQSSRAGTGHAPSLREDLGRVSEAAREQGAAAYEKLKEGAQAIGGEAQERLSRYATDQKEHASKNLDEFARAIRAASDDLNRRDQTMASQVVRQAAGGLESLSRSIGGSSFEQIVNSVRAFGRSNPTAFIGGAVLAGLALGRFAAATAHREERAGAQDSSEWMNEGEDAERGGPSRDRRESFASHGMEAGRSRPTSSLRPGGAPGLAQRQSPGPSSERDASLAASAAPGAAQPGNISTGEAP